MQGRMQTYTSGKPYRRPIGRYAPHVPVVDHLDASHAVVDLDREHVSAADFEIRIMRELKIRLRIGRTEADTSTRSGGSSCTAPK